MREINNTQIDNAREIDVVMSMYNLIEYGHVYSKTSSSLWQYYKDEPASDNNYNNTIDFPANRNNGIFKQQITWQTGNNDVFGEHLKCH